MGGATGSDDGPIGSNRTLVITLSTVLSVVGLLLILGGILICLRYRRRRFPFFSLQRGVSPIDDDEIATWRISRDEKHQAGGAAADNADGRFTSLPTAAGAPASTTTWTSPTLRKPPSLIIYNSPPQSASRFSSDDMGTPRTGNYYNAYQTFGGFTSPVNSNNGRPSLDLLPPTPVIVARAPNSRAGLTDESIPGDEPYIAVNRPVSRRLSKAPPGSSPRAHHHLRTRSSRSSTSVRSYGVDPAWYTDVELSPRPSTEFAGAGGNYGLQYNSSGSSGHQRTVSISSNGNTSYHHRTSSSSGAYSHHHNHSRVYSSSSVPPRLSLGDDFVGGGLSPRPLLRDEIGRAIG